MKVGDHLLVFAGVGGWAVVNVGVAGRHFCRVAATMCDEAELWLRGEWP